MTWLKRNLVWVIGLLVFVLAVLGSLLLLKNQITEKEKVADELETQIKELERLTSRPNFPDPSNVKDMQQDNEQMDQRINQLLKQFVKAQVPTENLTGIKFREVMNKRTQDLSRLARAQGVSVQMDYLFGFDRYEKNIPDNIFVPLLIKQLNVVDEITSTLFKSQRVLHLDGITRVDFEDAGMEEVAKTLRRKSEETTDMPNGYKGIQNDPAKMYTLMPFELSFSADPEGLRSFLNNLTRSKYLLIPAYIKVECDEKEVSGKVNKAEVTPEGKVVTPLPEEAKIAAETTKYVLGQRPIGVLMRIDWIEFRVPEPKEKRERRSGAGEKKEGEAAKPGEAAPAAAAPGAAPAAPAAPPAGGPPK